MSTTTLQQVQTDAIRKGLTHLGLSEDQIASAISHVVESSVKKTPKMTLKKNCAAVTSDDHVRPDVVSSVDAVTLDTTAVTQEDTVVTPKATVVTSETTVVTPKATVVKPMVNSQPTSSKFKLKIVKKDNESTKTDEQQELTPLPSPTINEESGFTSDGSSENSGNPSEEMTTKKKRTPSSKQVAYNEFLKKHLPLEKSRIEQENLNLSTSEVSKKAREAVSSAWKVHKTTI